jgi:hypothetical protein
MIASFDQYLARAYDHRRYNCLHFARDVMLDLTGVDIGERLAGVLDPETRTLGKRHFDAFRRLETPESPCLVFMSRRRGEPHVGVFARGRVLHIRERGVQFQPLEVAALGFEIVRYYSC